MNKQEIARRKRSLSCYIPRMGRRINEKATAKILIKEESDRNYRFKETL